VSIRLKWRVAVLFCHLETATAYIDTNQDFRRAAKRRKYVSRTATDVDDDFVIETSDGMPPPVLEGIVAMTGSKIAFCPGAMIVVFRIGPRMPISEVNRHDSDAIHHVNA
jgi:hypothetical protein